MADQSEVERAREELENLAVAASPTMVWEQAFAVALDALLAAVRAEERERCAKVCEAEATRWEGDGEPAPMARSCAAALREGGR